MSELSKWYQNTFLKKAETTDQGYNIFDKINQILDKKETINNNIEKNAETETEKVIQVSNTGTPENVSIVKKVEIVEPQKDIIKPDNDSEALEKETYLDRKTLEVKDDEYVEKRDKALQDRLLVLTKTLEKTILRLDLYKDYYNDNMKYLERRRLLDQVRSLYRSFGKTFSELNL